MQIDVMRKKNLTPNMMKKYSCTMCMLAKRMIDVALLTLITCASLCDLGIFFHLPMDDECCQSGKQSYVS